MNELIIALALAAIGLYGVTAQIGGVANAGLATAIASVAGAVLLASIAYGFYSRRKRGAEEPRDPPDATIPPIEKRTRRRK